MAARSRGWQAIHVISICSSGPEPHRKYCATRLAYRGFHETVVSGGHGHAIFFADAGGSFVANVRFYWAAELIYEEIEQRPGARRHAQPAPNHHRLPSVVIRSLFVRPFAPPAAGRNPHAQFCLVGSIDGWMADVKFMLAALAHARLTHACQLTLVGVTRKQMPQSLKRKLRARIGGHGPATAAWRTATRRREMLPSGLGGFGKLQPAFRNATACSCRS